jgi:hypothetical protein
LATDQKPESEDQIAVRWSGGLTGMRIMWYILSSLSSPFLQIFNEIYTVLNGIL